MVPDRAEHRLRRERRAAVVQVDAPAAPRVSSLQRSTSAGETGMRRGYTPRGDAGSLPELAGSAAGGRTKWLSRTISATSMS